MRNGEVSYHILQLTRCASHARSCIPHSSLYISHFKMVSITFLFEMITLPWKTPSQRRFPKPRQAYCCCRGVKKLQWGSGSHCDKNSLSKKYPRWCGWCGSTSPEEFFVPPSLQAFSRLCHPGQKRTFRLLYSAQRLPMCRQSGCRPGGLCR